MLLKIEQPLASSNPRFANYSSSFHKSSSKVCFRLLGSHSLMIILKEPEWHLHFHERVREYIGGRKQYAKFLYLNGVFTGKILMAALHKEDEVVDERNLLSVALEVGCSNLSQVVRSFILHALVAKSSLNVTIDSMENRWQYCQTTVENILDSKELHVSVKLSILTVILNELIRLQSNLPTAASIDGGSHSRDPDSGFGNGNYKVSSAPEGIVSIINFLLLGVISRIIGV